MGSLQSLSSKYRARRYSTAFQRADTSQEGPVEAPPAGVDGSQSQASDGEEQKPLAEKSNEETTGFPALGEICMQLTDFCQEEVCMAEMIQYKSNVQKEEAACPHSYWALAFRFLTCYCCRGCTQNRSIGNGSRGYSLHSTFRYDALIF